MNINTIDKVLLFLKGKLSVSDEVALRERAASDEDYAEDVAFSVNLMKAAEAYERNKLLEQVRRLDARRTLRIRIAYCFSGLIILGAVLFGFKGSSLLESSETNVHPENLLPETDLVFALQDSLPFVYGGNQDVGSIKTSIDREMVSFSRSINSSLANLDLVQDNLIRYFRGLSGTVIPFRLDDESLIEIDDAIYVAILKGEYVISDSLLKRRALLRLGALQSLENLILEQERQANGSLEKALGSKVDSMEQRDEIPENVKERSWISKKSPVLKRQLTPGEEVAFERASVAENKTYGYLYTWASAKAACPNLMPIEDWDALIEAHGGIHDRMAADDKSTFQGLLDAGYPIALGGQIRKKDGPISGFKKEGWYWSKTEVNRNTAWAYYFYKEFDEYKIVKKKVRKTSYLSCLCPE